MDIAIVGAGAIGSRIAAHLAQQGTGSTLIDGWAEHVQALNREGLRLKRTGRDDEVFPVQAYPYDALPRRRFDAVLVAVRSDATRAVLPIVQELLDDAGYVVSCQNGLNEEEIAEAVGADRTLGCSMIFGARLTAPGTVSVLEGADTLRLGEFTGAHTDRLDALAQLLSACGTVTTTPNLRGYRWTKLVLNSTGNPLLLLSGLDGERLHDRVGARRLIIGLAAEILAVARREGANPEPLLGHPAETWLAPDALDAPALHESLVAHGRSLGTRRLSMAADFEARGRTEVGEITGKVVAKAGRLGLAVPLNREVLAQVQALEAGRIRPGLDHLEAMERRLGA